MTFNFFGFKKRSDIEDVVPKEVNVLPNEIESPASNGNPPLLQGSQK